MEKIHLSGSDSFNSLMTKRLAECKICIANRFCPHLIFILGLIGFNHAEPCKISLTAYFQATYRTVHSRRVEWLPNISSTVLMPGSQS